MSAVPDESTAQELFAPHEPISCTRDRIIAAALNLFYEQGFHAVGLDRIIRDVGVTKTTFYNHFESKDDLIVAAIEMRDRWESMSFEKTVRHFSDDTPRGTILAYFDALDLWFNDARWAGCLFITACAEFPGEHDPIHRAAAAHYFRASDAILELCDQLGVAAPEDLSRQIELLLEGCVVCRMIKHDNSAAKRARAAAEIILERHLQTSCHRDARVPGSKIYRYDCPVAC